MGKIIKRSIEKDKLINELETNVKNGGRLVCINGYVNEDGQMIVVYTIEHDEIREILKLEDQSEIPTATSIYIGAAWFEEEIEEVGILLADQVVPGHGDDQEEGDARQVEELEEKARPLAEQGIPEEDANGEDDGDEAFREHAEAHGGIEDEQVLLLFRPLEDVERDQAGVDEKGQGHVHDADRGDDELQR